MFTIVTNISQKYVKPCIEIKKKQWAECIWKMGSEK